MQHGLPLIPHPSSPIPRPPRALVFRAASQQAALVAAGVAGGSLLVALLLVARGLADGITFAAFLCYVVATLLAPVAGLAGYWALALNRLRYEIGDGALTIVWGLTRQVIPLANMQRVVRGRSLGTPRIDGLDLGTLPAHVGRGRVARLGDVLFYSTHRAPADLLYIVTAEVSYGISPTAPQDLIRALQSAAEAAANFEPPRQELRRHPLAAMPFWGDHFALTALGIATVLALAAVAVVFARYTAVPDRTIIGFPDTDTIGRKRALLAIPATAVSVFILNTAAALALHRILRPVAYILLLGAIYVSALLIVASFAAA
jgi:hypothetical protein